jgi:hypothetical protein
MLLIRGERFSIVLVWLFGNMTVCPLSTTVGVLHPSFSSRFLGYFAFLSPCTTVSLFNNYEIELPINIQQPELRVL